MWMKGLPRRMNEPCRTLCSNQLQQRRFLPPYSLLSVTEELISHPHEQEKMAHTMEVHHKNQTPVILKGAVAMAPAIQNWKSLDYWKSALSGHVGYVEIGGSYATGSVERPEIPLELYVDYLQLFEERYGKCGPIDPWGEDDGLQNPIPSSELVYLAQNDLLHNLYPDIIIPKFCDRESAPPLPSSQQQPSLLFGHGQLYSVMFWFGPRTCISPLHFDPLDNCLMQYVGRKRVLLMDPSSNHLQWHYSGYAEGQTNTSPIDMEMPDRQQFPLFFQARPPIYQAILHPGDVLYIPAKWWHHVKSLDTSASVNVWWR